MMRSWQVPARVRRCGPEALCKGLATDAQGVEGLGRKGGAAEAIDRGWQGRARCRGGWPKKFSAVAGRFPVSQYALGADGGRAVEAGCKAEGTAPSLPLQRQHEDWLRRAEKVCALARLKSGPPKRLRRALCAQGAVGRFRSKACPALAGGLRAQGRQLKGGEAEEQAQGGAPKG